MLLAPAVALEVGDQAPPLQVAEWLNRMGGDPGRPDGRSVYVVLFCVTWQEEGRAALAHLERLQARYQQHGLKCAAITREAPEKIKDALSETRRQCAIGVDADDIVHRAYGAMRIADLPLTFVIDKTGKIVWRGNPFPALERIMAKTLAGALTAEEGSKIVSAQEEAARAQRDGDEAALLQALERLLHLEPDAVEGHVGRTQIFLHRGDAEKAAEALQLWHKGCAASPVGLAALALFLLNQTDINFRNPRLALSSAREAYEMKGGKSEPVVFMALARIYAELGWLEKAVAVLQEGQGVFSGVEGAEAAALLAYYRQLLEVRSAERP